MQIARSRHQDVIEKFPAELSFTQRLATRSSLDNSRNRSACGKINKIELFLKSHLKYKQNMKREKKKKSDKQNNYKIKNCQEMSLLAL